MKIIKAVPGVPFSIGRQGEHKARQVQFNIAPWHALYGEGVVQLLFQRPGEEAPYPVAVDRQDTQVLWTVTSTDTAVKSLPRERVYGYAELRYYVNDTLVKSEISAVSIYDALDAPGEMPETPGQNWLDQAMEAGAQAKAAAQRAENAAIHQPIIQDGTWWIWNPETGIYEDSKTSASGSGGSADAVQYIKQDLTKEEQSQARSNIGAASAKEVNQLSDDKLDASKLPEAVNDALAQAKASGEFDGAPGKDGEDGKDGYTPVKGVDYFDGAQGPAGADGKTPIKGKDYFTDEDKSAMVNDVLASLPTWEGGSY